MEDDELFMTQNWEEVNFPLVYSLQGKWVRRNATLTALKSMFKLENLKPYHDYVIVINTEQREERTLTVRFRENGQGLICLMKWLGSNYYKEHSQ
jgi:RNase P protein component